MANPQVQTIFDEPADDDTIGNRILRAREAQGLKLSEAARNLGVRNATLDAWEKSKSEPRPHHLVRLAGMLGVSPAWLLSGRGQAPLNETIADEVQLIRGQLRQLKELRDQTTQVIGTIEQTLDRIIKLDDSQ